MDIIAYNPQIVLICGGINDTVSNASDAAALQTEATLLYRRILNNLQNCRLYVCGPCRGSSSLMCPTTSPAPATPGDGNNDYYIGYDRVHPSA